MPDPSQKQKRRTQAERREQTSARILAAARRAFSEQGYSEASTEAIVAESGVTRGALYHHFGSKQGLFEAVLGALMQEVARRVEERAEREAEPWNQLRAGCMAFLEASLDADFQRVALIDGPAVLGWQSWRRQDAEASVKPLRECLRALSDAGLIVAAPVEALTQMLSGAMNELALWVAQSSHRDAAMTEARVALEATLEGLRA